MCFDLIVTSKSLLALTRAVNIYICCRAQLGMHMYLRTHVTAQVCMHGCNCYFALKKITQEFFCNNKKILIILYLNANYIPNISALLE